MVEDIDEDAEPTGQIYAADQISADLQDIRKKIQEITEKRRAFLSSYLDKISNIDKEDGQ